MLLAVSGSYQGGNGTLKSLSFAAFAGKIINKLIVFNSPGMNENKKGIQDKKIKRESIKFAKNMNKKYFLKPPFPYLIWFSAFKAVSVIYKDECVADYNFYKDKKYFIDTNLNVIQNTIVAVFTGLFTYLLKKGFI